MNVARTASFGVFVFLMASTPALADTTTLICHLNGGDTIIEDEPTTIDLNEAQNSVVIHFGANHYNLGRVDVEQAVSVGPFQAIFGPDTITFNNNNNAYTGPYTLSRVTGVLANTSIGWRWTCEAGSKKF